MSGTRPARSAPPTVAPQAVIMSFPSFPVAALPAPSVQ